MCALARAFARAKRASRASAHAGETGGQGSKKLIGRKQIGIWLLLLNTTDRGHHFQRWRNSFVFNN